MIPVGLQLYSVRNELEKDFEGTLKKVAQMGYKGVEFAGLFDKTADEVKSLLEKYSLTPVSAHVPLAQMLEDMDEVIKTYSCIGCKYIAIPYVEEKYRPGSPDYSETLKIIENLGKKAAENGITLLYHNHDFEFTKVDGEYGLDIMYSTVPAKYLQTELDTCWVNVAGENPVAYIEKYNGRTPVIHLKDFVMAGKEKPAKLYDLIGLDDDTEAASEEDFSFKPVGYGVQDIPAIIEAGKKSGAEWFIVEQDQPDKGNTEFTAAEKSISYLNSLEHR